VGWQLLLWGCLPAAVVLACLLFFLCTNDSSTPAGRDKLKRALDALSFTDVCMYLTVGPAQMIEPCPHLHYRSLLLFFHLSGFFKKNLFFQNYKKEFITVHK
jgi:hypothetical protein